MWATAVVWFLASVQGAQARECARYSNYAGEFTGSNDVRIEATKSSACSRAGSLCYHHSKEWDAIKLQVYNGKAVPINIEVTFNSGNTYDLGRTIFPVKQSTSTVLYPQKEDIQSRFSWRVREVIRECEEWKPLTDSESERWFKLCIGYKSTPNMTSQTAYANSIACREAAKNPTWLQKQLWKNF